MISEESIKRLDQQYFLTSETVFINWLELFISPVILQGVVKNSTKMLHSLSLSNILCSRWNLIAFSKTVVELWEHHFNFQFNQSVVKDLYRCLDLVLISTPTAFDGRGILGSNNDDEFCFVYCSLSDFAELLDMDSRLRFVLKPLQFMHEFN